MRKLCIGLTIMFIALLLSNVALAQLPLSQAAKEADFEALVEFVERNYPFLWVNQRRTKENWLDNRDKYHQMVLATQTDQEFYQVMGHIVARLNNAHTHFINPHQYQDWEGRLTGPWPQVFNERNYKLNQEWQQILPSQANRPPIYARYIAGDYWILSSTTPDLPIGARITTVNGKDVHDYVAAGNHNGYLRKDTKRDLLYSWSLPLNYPPYQIGYEFDNRQRQVAIPTSWFKKTPQHEDPENIYTSTLVPGKIGYLRVRSFGIQHYEQDAKQILPYLESIKDYPYLIIDIRGNGGGAVKFWADLLVGPTISQTVATSHYVTLRSSGYLQEFVKSRLALGYYMMQVERYHLAEKLEVPQEILGGEFTSPLFFPTVITPTHQPSFAGQIILLVDDMVYSSSEALAAFAKETNWATVVGTNTGGDGIGFDPAFFALPYSGLILRMTQVYGLNADGTANEEYPTSPHVYVELDPELYSTLLTKIEEGALPANQPNLDYDTVLGKAKELIAKDDLVSFNPAEHTLSKTLGRMFTDLAAPAWHRVRSQTDFPASSQYLGSNITEIKIHGASKTDKDLLRKLIDLEGRTYSPSQTYLVEKRLNMLDSIRNIILTPVLVGDNQVRIDVIVQEGHPILGDHQRITEQLITDMLEKQISVKYRLHELLTTIEGSYGLGDKRQRFISLEFPTLFGVLAKTTLSGGTTKRATTITWGSKREGSFEIEQTAYSGVLETYLTPNALARLEISALSENVLKQAGVNLQSSSYLDGNLTLIGVTEEEDSQIRGMLQVGSLNRYGYFHLQGEVLVPLMDDISLTVSAKAGLKDKGTPLQHQFSLGGPGSFAAYSPGIIGSSYLAGSLELDFALTENTSLLLLTDSGQVWESTDPRDFSHPLLSVGGGIRYETPLGLRLEAIQAYSPRHDRQRFSLGLSGEF